MKNHSSAKNILSSKDSILFHALSLFTHLGFSKTTMNDIANASNKGRRTIYTYFKNKEEIFLAVVDRELTKIIDPLALKVEKEKKPDQQLKVYLEGKIYSFLQLVKENKILQIAYNQKYGHISPIRKKISEHERYILKNILQAGIEQDLFKPKDVNHLTKSLSMFIKAMELSIIKEKDKNTSKIEIQTLCEILIEGLKK